MTLRKENEIILKATNNEIGLNFTNNSEWVNGYNFIQMADTQFGLTEQFKTGNDDKWEVEILYLRQSIKLINKMEPLPKFLVVCGDMINSFPGEPNRDKQIYDLLQTFRELLPSIPLICVCGNHDVGNTPTNQSLAEYRKDFGDDYMKFWVKGVKYLVINSQFYHDKSMCEEEALKHEKWLNFELNHKENKLAKHLIIFQHIPWFIDNVKEPDEYFNIKTGIRKEMLEKFIKSGVSKIFAGHTHKNAGGWYIHSKDQSIELVITSAVGYQLGTDDHGFRIVTVEEDKVLHKYQSVFIE